MASICSPRTAVQCRASGSAEMATSGAAALVERIDRLLPQTQCGKCGHSGCRPYAQAIATGEAHTKCPPGGERTLIALAQLLDRPKGALERPAETPQIAVIREDECIGCTKCIQACPVDAIVGAAKLMHGVLESECTGCELCVAPCPVDCIDMRPHPRWQEAGSDAARERYLALRADNGRRRFDARRIRLAERERAAKARRLERLQRRLPAKAPSSSETAAAPTPRSSDPRTAATIARLEHKLARLEGDAPERAALEARLAEARNGSGASVDRAQHQRQLRIALSAAEQRRRLAERQLRHSQRQQGEQEITEARRQLERALDTERQAQLALTNSAAP